MSDSKRVRYSHVLLSGSRGALGHVRPTNEPVSGADGEPALPDEGRTPLPAPIIVGVPFYSSRLIHGVTAEVDRDAIHGRHNAGVGKALELLTEMQKHVAGLGVTPQDAAHPRELAQLPAT